MSQSSFNEPSNLSGWQLVAKFFIGLFIGGVISALLFVVLSFMGGMFTSAYGNQAGTTVNPLLSIILLFIGFISTFIGNIAVAGAYNLFYGRRYVNTSKTFAILFLTNGILFFILAPIYLVFASQIEILFFVLGFHVLFSVFVSAAQIEFSTNPNYSSSAFMGNILGFALALLAYAVFYKASGSAEIQQKIYLFMLLPAVLGYALMPFGAGIRDKIYYKFYELGNNGFYTPSLEETEDESNDEDTTGGNSEDVNVEN